MDHPTSQKPARSRRQAIATSLALVAAGVLIGVTSQNSVSADISSGDRPVLIPIEPCRLSDTRPGDNQVGPRSAPLAAADTHTVDAQQTATPCTGNIPTDALALSLNVTALNATELSFLTIWAGGDRPLAASLNPAPGQPPVPNAVTTQLSVDQEFEVYNNAGTVNIVIDVNGYYTNHNHDDRYYTEAESESRFTDSAEVQALIDAAIGAERARSAGRLVGVGAVFSNDPPTFTSAEFADGFTATVSGSTEGRQFIEVTGPFEGDFPRLVVTPLLGVDGVSCRIATSGFTPRTVNSKFDATVDCANASGTPLDVSFNFVVFDTAPS